MASVKISITQHFMKSFLTKPFASGNRIYTDAETKGLELRVQGKRAFWFLRYKKESLIIAYAVVPKETVEPRIVTTGNEARLLNATVRSLIDRDRDLVEPFLVNYFAVGDAYRDTRKAEAAAVEAVARSRNELGHHNCWTLQEALDNFVEKRMRPGQRKPIKQSYAKELRSTFGRKEFEPVINAPVTKLTPRLAEDIRDTVEKRSGISPSKKAVNAIRTVMSYTFEKHRGQSGLEGTQPWWLMLTSDTVINPRERRPEIDGIGKTLALASYFLDHRLPGRQGVQHGLRDNVFAALVWIVLSGQRQSSGLSLRSSNLIPYPGKSGWKLAHWEADVMKNNRRFVLPIPPRMADLLDELIQRARHVQPPGHEHDEEADWAFPSEDGPDIHVSRSATLAVLKRLSGRDELMKNDPAKVDLLGLNGIDYWTPHDTRRAVTKAMDDSGMPGGASAILAHTIEAGSSEGRMTDSQFGIWLLNKVANVTRDSYGDVQFLDLKSKAMQVWTDFVIDAWEAAQRDGVYIDANRTLSVPAPKADQLRLVS